MLLAIVYLDFVLNVHSHDTFDFDLAELCHDSQWISQVRIIEMWSSLNQWTKKTNLNYYHCMCY